MNYKEHVDTMLAHMASDYSTTKMLQVLQALGQGMAKAVALMPSREIQATLLHNAHKAIVTDAEAIGDRYLVHCCQHGVNEHTAAVFLDSLRSPRRVSEC